MFFVNKQKKKAHKWLLKVNTNHFQKLITNENKYFYWKLSADSILLLNNNKITSRPITNEGKVSNIEEKNY